MFDCMGYIAISIIAVILVFIIWFWWSLLNGSPEHFDYDEFDELWTRDLLDDERRENEEQLSEKD